MADPRDEMAANRTLFAAERTFAAWMRTGLASLASGVGAKALLAAMVPEWVIRGAGTVLVVFSVFCFVAAVWRELRPGLPPPRPTTPRIRPVVLMSFSLLLILVSLSALLGIWLGRSGAG